MHNIKAAAIKATIVLVPTYLAAFITDKMVYVVPTLAAVSFFASTIDLKEKDLRRQVDEDGDDSEDDDSETTDTEGDA